MLQFLTKIYFKSLLGCTVLHIAQNSVQNY